MNIGDKVAWETVNGKRTGEIVGFCPQGIIVQTRPGYHIIADERSLKRV